MIHYGKKDQRGLVGIGRITRPKAAALAVVIGWVSAFAAGLLQPKTGFMGRDSTQNPTVALGLIGATLVNLYKVAINST